MQLYQYIQQGGLIMYLLIFLNIVGLTIMLSKFFIYLQNKKNSMALIESLGAQIKDNINNKEANAIIELAKQAIANHIGKQEKGLNTIKIIASISPLLGLLGTVVGVLIAFQMMSQNGLSDPSQFADGISMALITTVGGMIVAIPHFIGHNYLLGMLDDYESLLEKELLTKVL